MADGYTYTAILVVPAAEVATTEALVSQVLGRDCTGEIGAPMSANGLTLTHYGCCAALKQSEYVALLAAFFGEGSPGAALGAEVYTVVTPCVDVAGATAAVPDGEGGWVQLPIAVIGVGDDVPDPAVVHPLCRRWTVDRVLVEIGLAPWARLE